MIIGPFLLAVAFISAHRPASALGRRGFLASRGYHGAVTVEQDLQIITAA